MTKKSTEQKETPLDNIYASYLEALSVGTETVSAEERLYKELVKVARIVAFPILRFNDPDFSHDVAVNIILASPNFRGDSLYSTWAYAIAKHAALRARLKSKKMVDLEAAIELEAPQSIHQEVLIKRLKEELSGEDRQLFEKMMEPGFYVQAAADELGVHFEIVNRRVIKLRKKLEELCYGKVGELV